MTEPDRWIGTTIAGRYRILDKLGDGGMGSVYRAVQLSVDRVVAVKFLHPHMMQNAEALKRFEREARTCSKLRHSNVIHLYDFGTENRCAYLVTEYIDGQSLRTLLDGVEGVSLSRFTDLVGQICDALGEAHHLGIVHRDLKPANIMLAAPRAGRVQVKVLDFGIAKIAEAGEASTVMTQTGMIMGTPQYMSPEQAEGADGIDHRSDIYSLGIIMYEMLTGVAPFIADTPLQLLMKQVKDRPMPPRDLKPDLSIPAGLEAVVLKALEKKPEDRYQRVEDLQADLLADVNEEAGAFRGDAFEAALSGLALPKAASGGGERLEGDPDGERSGSRAADGPESPADRGQADGGIATARGASGSQRSIRHRGWILAIAALVVLGFLGVWWVNQPINGDAPHPATTRITDEAERPFLLASHGLELVWIDAENQSRYLFGTTTIRDDRGLLRLSGAAGNPERANQLLLEGFLTEVDSLGMTFVGTLHVAIPGREPCEREENFRFSMPRGERKWSLSRKSPCDGIQEIIFIPLK